MNRFPKEGLQSDGPLQLGLLVSQPLEVPQLVGQTYLPLLGRSRYPRATLGTRAVRLFADELDVHLLPQVGYPWMPQGATDKLGTPGQNQQPYLAGA
jgi:hypothetical protein